MNHFLEHYLANEITPVKQDISDLKKHFARRIALYKTLGVPPLFFKNKKILEVGAGGGYNPLVTQSFDLNSYDIVEPNKHARDDIDMIFSQHKVEMKNIKIHDCMLENYENNAKYDVVICEGVIPGLHNKKEVLGILDDLLKPNGIMLLTCIDEVSYLFEILRHYIASKLIENECDFEKKLDIFEEAFESHLDTLDGMSRYKRDWYADSLLGTMHFNYNFSFKECIEYFNKNYTFYNSSPNIFMDYRWYKEIPSDNTKYNQYFIEQFDKNRHNLMHYNTIYSDREKDKNDILVSLCKKMFLQIEDSVINKIDTHDAIVSLLNDISNNIFDLREENAILADALADAIELIANKDYIPKNISSKYENFKKAFGRGTFYVSLIKENNYVK
jgi:2-polyprenyl-3-methyl-5-hydroxy-6-metoxy-1,4-benzoquinol methylase